MAEDFGRSVKAQAEILKRALQETEALQGDPSEGIQRIRGHLYYALHKASSLETAHESVLQESQSKLKAAHLQESQFVFTDIALQTPAPHSTLLSPQPLEMSAREEALEEADTAIGAGVSDTTLCTEGRMTAGKLPARGEACEAEPGEPEEAVAGDGGSDDDLVLISRPLSPASVVAEEKCPGSPSAPLLMTPLTLASDGTADDAAGLPRTALDSPGVSPILSLSMATQHFSMCADEDPMIPIQTDIEEVYDFGSHTPAALVGRVELGYWSPPARSAAHRTNGNSFFQSKGGEAAGAAAGKAAVTVVHHSDAAAGKAAPACTEEQVKEAERAPDACGSKPASRPEACVRSASPPGGQPAALVRSGSPPRRELGVPSRDQVARHASAALMRSASPPRSEPEVARRDQVERHGMKPPHEEVAVKGFGAGRPHAPARCAEAVTETSVLPCADHVKVGCSGGLRAGGALEAQPTAADRARSVAGRAALELPADSDDDALLGGRAGSQLPPNRCSPSPTLSRPNALADLRARAVALAVEEVPKGRSTASSSTAPSPASSAAQQLKPLRSGNAPDPQSQQSETEEQPHATQNIRQRVAVLEEKLRTQRVAASEHSAVGGGGGAASRNASPRPSSAAPAKVQKKPANVPPLRLQSNCPALAQTRSEHFDRQTSGASTAAAAWSTPRGTARLSYRESAASETMRERVAMLEEVFRRGTTGSEEEEAGSGPAASQLPAAFVCKTLSGKKQSTPRTKEALEAQPMDSAQGAGAWEAASCQPALPRSGSKRVATESQQSSSHAQRSPQEGGEVGRQQLHTSSLEADSDAPRLCHKHSARGRECQDAAGASKCGSSTAEVGTACGTGSSGEGCNSLAHCSCCGGSGKGGGCQGSRMQTACLGGKGSTQCEPSQLELSPVSPGASTTTAAPATSPPPEVRKAKGQGKAPPPPPKAAAAKPPPRRSTAPAAKARPAPRKQEVKPKTVMKKLFWNSFILEEAVWSASRSVWSNLGLDASAGLAFDTEELEQWFGELPAAGRNATKHLHGRLEAVQKKRRVLGESRRRQLCVMLARLPPVEQTVEAIAEMDDARLSKDQVELLLANIPQSDEISSLQVAPAAEGDGAGPVEWDDAEAFLLQMTAIPAYGARLQIWAFENCFDERFEAFQAAASDIQAACRALRTSPQIHRILGMALSVGNYLNAGTNRGQADGFSMEALVQMRMLKSQQGGSLVDFIVRELEKAKPGHLDNLFGEFGDVHVVKRSARHKLSDLVQDLTSYRAQAEQLVRSASRPGGSTTAVEDVALRVRGRRVETRVHELVVLQEMYAKAEEEYRELCAWFHDGEGKASLRPCDEFFGIWDEFLQSVGRSLEGLQHRSRRKKAQLLAARRPLNSVKKALHSTPPGSDYGGLELLDDDVDGALDSQAGWPSRQQRRLTV